jgi:hypothetical protein
VLDLLATLRRRRRRRSRSSTVAAARDPPPPLSLSRLLALQTGSGKKAESFDGVIGLVGLDGDPKGEGQLVWLGRLVHLGAWV